MKRHAMIGAGYLNLIGNVKRSSYLLEEIKSDFGIEV